MHPLIQVNKVVLVALILVSFGLAQVAQAVSPPPDGGYPGANTAEGQEALLNLNTGDFNMAVGWLSIATLTTGQLNTAIGAGTLLYQHRRRKYGHWCREALEQHHRFRQYSKRNLCTLQQHYWQPKHSCGA